MLWRRVANRFDVNPVRIVDECAIIVFMISANAGGAIVCSSGRQRGLVEGIDLRAFEQ